MESLPLLREPQPRTDAPQDGDSTHETYPTVREKKAYCGMVTNRSEFFRQDSQIRLKEGK